MTHINEHVSVILVSSLINLRAGQISQLLKERLKNHEFIWSKRTLE